MTPEQRSALLHRRHKREFDIYPHDQWVKDLIVLAEGFDAEHHADDDEPATVEWAASCGASRGGNAAWWTYPHPADSNVTNRLRLESGVVLLFDNDPGTLTDVCVLCNATIGQVRRLCSVLGIKLKEPT